MIILMRRTTDFNPAVSFWYHPRTMVFSNGWSMTTLTALRGELIWRTP